MASFYGGCGEVPPQPSGWQRPDASRFINNAREGGQVTALAFPLRPQNRSRDQRLHARFCAWARASASRPLARAVQPARREALWAQISGWPRAAPLPISRGI